MNFLKEHRTEAVVATAAGVIAALALAGSANSASSSANKQQTPTDCKMFAGNLKQARACLEYATLVVPAKTGFFKFGNYPDPDTSLKDSSRKVFESRYFGNARKSIETTVDQWPDAEYSVHNGVKVIAVSVDKQAGRAIIGANEEWTVYSPDHKVKLKEKVLRVVTMCRISRLGLDKYVVVKEVADDKFPCKTLSATKQKIDPKKVTTA